MKKHAVIAIAALGVMMAIGQARAQTTPFVYSVKYLCGVQAIPSTQFSPPIEPPVKPGNYATSVNIHNYHLKPFVIQTKAVVSGGVTGRLAGQGIGANQALNLDCSRIVRMIPPGPVPLPAFIEGFVEIVSPLGLSVAGVYTTQTCNTPAGSKGCGSFGSLSIEVVPQTAFRDQ